MLATTLSLQSTEAYGLVAGVVILTVGLGLGGEQIISILSFATPCALLATTIIRVVPCATLLYDTCLLAMS